MWRHKTVGIRRPNYFQRFDAAKTTKYRKKAQLIAAASYYNMSQTTDAQSHAAANS